MIWDMGKVGPWNLEKSHRNEISVATAVALTNELVSSGIGI